MTLYGITDDLFFCWYTKRDAQMSDQFINIVTGKYQIFLCINPFKSDWWINLLRITGSMKPMI